MIRAQQCHTRAYAGLNLGIVLSLSDSTVEQERGQLCPTSFR